MHGLFRLSFVALVLRTFLFQFCGWFASDPIFHNLDYTLEGANAGRLLRMHRRHGWWREMRATDV